MKRFIFLAVISLLLTGCKTVPIQDREAIRIPSGLSKLHAEAAILVTIGNHTANESSLSDWQMITDNALRSALKGYKSAERSGYERYWYFEERGQDVIFVGFRKKDLYMRVSLRFDNKQIKSEIVESKNFRQTKEVIHKNAYMYLQDFEDRLHRSLGDIARMVSYENIQADGVKSTPNKKSRP